MKIKATTSSRRLNRVLIKPGNRRHNPDSFLAPRHSGERPPAWMQVVEPRLERRPRNPVVDTIHSRSAGMTAIATITQHAIHQNLPFIYFLAPTSWIPAFACLLQAGRNDAVTGMTEAVAVLHAGLPVSVRRKSMDSDLQGCRATTILRKRILFSFPGISGVSA